VKNFCQLSRPCAQCASRVEDVIYTLDVSDVQSRVHVEQHSKLSHVLCVGTGGAESQILPLCCTSSDSPIPFHPYHVVIIQKKEERHVLAIQ